MNASSEMPEAPTERLERLTTDEIKAWRPLVGKLVRWRGRAHLVHAVTVVDSSGAAVLESVEVIDVR